MRALTTASPITIFHFQTFTLEYNDFTMGVTTKFQDGTWSGGRAVHADLFHGEKLGLTPGGHRLIHELAHHLVALWNGQPYCPIVWADAHHQSMPEGANTMEWQITALCYFCREAPMRDPQEWGAIMSLARINPDIHALSRWLRSLMLHRFMGKVDGHAVKVIKS